MCILPTVATRDARPGGPNLCIDCFRIFHTKKNVKDKKENLAMMLASRKKMAEDKKKVTKK